MEGPNKEQEIINVLEKMRGKIETTGDSKILSEVKDKDIILFVGNAKCGKSTIVNYVIGNPLRVNQVRRTFKITKQDPNSDGPSIDERDPLNLELPTAWTSSRVDGICVDAVGFDEHCDVAEDVGNAFLMKAIIQCSKSVKLVLISDISDLLSDNIKNFTNFIDRIHDMLPQDEQIFKGMVMVYTKDRDNYTTAEIDDVMKTKIIDEHTLNIKNRKLIEYLHKNLSQIVIVKMPTVAGPIDEDEVFNSLLETIKYNVVNISANEMSSIAPGLSEKSNIFLSEAFQYFTELKQFKDVLRRTIDVFSRDNIKKNIPDGQIDDEEKRLQTLKQRVDSIREKKSTYGEKLKELSTLVPDVMELHVNAEIYSKLKYLDFIDSILKTNSGDVLNVKIYTTLSEMVLAVSHEIIDLKERTLKISTDDARRLKDDEFKINAQKAIKYLKETLLNRHNEKTWDNMIERTVNSSMTFFLGNKHN